MNVDIGCAACCDCMQCIGHRIEGVIEHSVCCLLLVDAKACCCSRVFPNEEIDQFATAVRQVARTLWAVHVTLQMGFEEEVWPNSFLA